MSALSHQALEAALRMQPLEKRLVVAPLLDEEQIGPGTIDLRLGTEFIETHRLRKGVLDPLDDDEPLEGEREERVVVPLGDHLMLHPGQFVLGSTLEFVRMPTHMIGQVLGRSSWARLGLIVATAVVVQPGFGGVLTLELVNMGNVPMKLRPGLRVAQLMVWMLDEPTDKPYQPSSKYGSPIGPEPSRLGWESGERDRLIKLGRLLSRQETVGDEQI
ncbi:MAG: dCTP deaminase [Actinomycetota bacterium]